MNPKRQREETEVVALREFAFQGAPLVPLARKSIFKEPSDRTRALDASVQHVNFFHPHHSRLNQRNAVRRFVEFLDFIVEIDIQSLHSAGLCGRLLDIFFLARSGYIFVHRGDIIPPEWKSFVKTTSALSEVYSISSALQELGLPAPDLVELNKSVAKLHVRNQKASGTKKPPLRLQHLHQLWSSRCFLGL